MKHRIPAGLAAGLTTATLLAGPAQAAPVTVDLRIEGPSTTIFEGPVRTDARAFRFTDDPVEHRCDGTAASGGPSAMAVPTRGAVITEASEVAPFSLVGTWNEQFGSPTFDSIGGEPVAYDPATFRFLAEYENGRFASLGACGDSVQDGDDVLFAYADGSEVLLALNGRVRARADRATSVLVTDAATGEPVAGASVAGATTGANGRATVGPFGEVGHVDLKATKPGTIRSNRLRVCVTVRPCGGSRDTTAPRARIRGIRNGGRYVVGPRELRGTVGSDPAGVRSVRLSLTRRRAGRCANYSARVERFVRRRCGRPSYFRVEADGAWSYLLPERLGRGRYVLHALAVDGAGNRDRIRRGRNRVAFRVR